MAVEDSFDKMEDLLRSLLDPKETVSRVVERDAAGNHLLAYDPGHRVQAVNLTNGHQASISVAQIPCLDGAYNTAAW